MLHKCKKVETIVRKFWRLIPTFVGVTAEKLVGRGGGGGGQAFCWGGGDEFIQNFHKGETYLIGENFVGKKFSLGTIFVT